jgi:Mce-associated membrane protein
MTKPRSDDADRKSAKPEGESAAVRVETDAASELGTEKSGAVSSADAESEPDSQDAKPDKATGTVRRRRARASGVEGRRGSRGARARARGVTKPASGETDDQTEQPDDESRAGDEKAPSDATKADAQDSEDSEAAISEDAEAEEATAEEKAEEGGPAKAKFRVSWPRVLAYGVIPGIALLLAGAAGFLKWQDSSARASQLAGIESMAAAKDSTIALLSYKADTVEKDLDAAKSRLTGTFKESYSQLISDVVIPGARRGHISTTATVPAAALVSATPSHAVTLLFVNQTAVVDKEPPTDSTSSVRVTLDKINGHWLISGFDPV